VRYGCERLHTLLRREGWQINHKRVYRLYHEEGFSEGDHKSRVISTADFNTK
jgi:transposase